MGGASKDWKGRQFFFVSLAVTALSIIFFFAAKLLFNKIDMLDASFFRFDGGEFVQRLSDFGGASLEHVSVHFESEFSTGYEAEVETALKSLEGKSLFLIDTKNLSKSYSKLAWVKSASFLRKFPSSLEVYIETRPPFLYVHSEQGWASVDEEGVFLSLSKALSSRAFEKPKVFGIENLIVGDVDHMNRHLTIERKWLADLSQLIQSVEASLETSVSEVKISQDEWFESAIFELSWWNSEADREISVSFQAFKWESRIESLQAILSELDNQSFKQARLTGEYSGRWIVEVEE